MKKQLSGDLEKVVDTFSSEKKLIELANKPTWYERILVCLRLME